MGPLIERAVAESTVRVELVVKLGCPRTSAAFAKVVKGPTPPSAVTPPSAATPPSALGPPSGLGAPPSAPATPPSAAATPPSSVTTDASPPQAASVSVATTREAAVVTQRPDEAFCL